jgi:serine/threonine protein kinase
MVQEKLGFTLEKYLFKRNDHFSPSCAFKIGIQLVDQMRIIHDAGYTYNDLKLDNILVGDCKEMPNYK